MIDKRVADLAAAVDGIADGATIMIGGFGGAGTPDELMLALAAKGVRDITIVANNAGAGGSGIGELLSGGCIRKAVCSFPRVPGTTLVEELFEAGKLELELVPQGTLAERIRCAGAGIKGFYTRTGVGTPLAQGKEHREFDGETWLFEPAIPADLALIKAERGDRWGNLTYRKTARNFNPVMATATPLTIAQVYEIVALGDIDPEHVVTPGMFVDRVVEVERTG